MPDDLIPSATPEAPAQIGSPQGDGPPASPASPAPSSWPTDWRESFAKSRNDEKLAARLGRYASPEAALDALVSVQNKISAGELRSHSPFPAQGTPEEQAKWRQSAGIPEAPEKYEVKLDEGLVLGDEDKPVVDAFLKAAHKANLPSGAVNDLLRWYFGDVVEGEVARRQDLDEKVRQEVDDKLHVEWGQDYRKNKMIIEAYLDSGPPGVKDLLFGARLADGTPLASNLEVLRFLADKGREFNPTIHLVPGDPTTAAQAITSEISNLQAMMGNKSSEYWKGPKAESLQARYRELLDAKTRISQRAA